MHLNLDMFCVDVCERNGVGPAQRGSDSHTLSHTLTRLRSYMHTRTRTRTRARTRTRTRTRMYPCTGACLAILLAGRLGDMGGCAQSR